MRISFAGKCGASRRSGGEHLRKLQFFLHEYGEGIELAGPRNLVTGASAAADALAKVLRRLTNRIVARPHSRGRVSLGAKPPDWEGGIDGRLAR